MKDVLLRLALVACLSAAPALGAVVEEVVEFQSHDGLTLEAILSYPDGDDGPLPGVLLIHGSGLHDADQTVDEPALNITRGPQKHFRALARQLSKRGFAVLRFNKRGASFDHLDDRPNLLAQASMGDLIEDARAALRRLLEDARTGPSMTVFGHSEGTLIAPRLAREEPAVDLVVLLGSVSHSMADLLRYQLVERHIDFFHGAADVDGDGSLTLDELDAIDGNFGLSSLFVVNAVPALFDFETLDGGDIEVQGLSSTTDSNGDGSLAIESEIRDALETGADAFLAALERGELGRYPQSWLELQPMRKFIGDLEQPILIVQGDLDVQTPLSEALDLVGRLDKAGKSDYELLRFGKLGHSLSKPNNTIDTDGGLTTFDNPTLNNPTKKARKKIAKRMRAWLGL